MQCAVDAVEIKWTVLQKQPTEYDGKSITIIIAHFTGAFKTGLHVHVRKHNAD